jgi:hypothetical protein
MSVKKSTQNVIYLLPSGMLWIHSPTHIYRLIGYSDCNVHSCLTAFYWVRNVHAPPNLTIPTISHHVSPCPTHYHHVLPYPATSHHVPPVSPRPTITRHATTCPTVSYHIPPHIAMANQALYHKSHHASPNPIEPHHIQPILTILHHILPYPAMSHHVSSRPAMSHYCTTYPSSLSYRKVVLQILTIYFPLTLLSVAYYNKIQGIFPKKQQACWFRRSKYQIKENKKIYRILPKFNFSVLCLRRLRSWGI